MKFCATTFNFKTCQRFSTLVFSIFFALILIARPASAGIFSPLFNFYISTEISNSEVSGGGSNSNFKNRDDLGQSAADLKNLALGFHLRFFDRIGVNANWTQNNLTNTALSGVSALNGKASFKTDQFNLTGLVFVPILSNHIEFFGEAGVAQFGSSLSYNKNDNGNSQFVLEKSRQTTGVYGGGLQVSLLGSDFIRFSAQKYTNRVGPIVADYVTYRLGYLKSF